ncbi:hypothetical protein [Dendronalium sp. ChiSLP03b]|uniref:hypothetical protein n=1 Tax=Dendronalium sp. ChiSLP03b TaxID=3075381 RepID=UPI002ADC61B0|nr:hypothetical protein [Dendronalium sp. ChiSLP03b]
MTNLKLKDLPKKAFVKPRSTHLQVGRADETCCREAAQSVPTLLTRAMQCLPMSNWHD